MTIPLGEGIHRRMVYVELEDGASLDEVTAAIKARPGQITFGTGGVGSGGHFGTQVLSAIAGSEVKHTPYNGGSAAVTALLSKEIDVCPQLLAELKDLIISAALR